MSVGCNPQIVIDPDGIITVECMPCMFVKPVKGPAEATEARDVHLDKTIKKLRESLRSGC